MFKQFITGLIILLSVQNLFAQKLVVLDASDSKPIKDVAVYNDSKTKFGYTDLAGAFSINTFDDKDYLNFQHPSYQNLRLTRKEVEDNEYIVLLLYKTFDIDEFVVSANRWEQNKQEVPNKIVQIRKPEIDFINPQTAADLLSSSDEVFIQKSQLGGGSPMIRGFATNRVLIVVDGVRMNNAIFREGNVQNIISLDPNIIESTEVIFGPGAIVYGSDAIGGVMNFNTNKALLSTSEKTNVRVEAMARRSTANNETTGHVHFNIGGSKIAFLSSVTFSTFDDLMMGAQMHPDYVRQNYAKQVDGVDSMFVNTDPNLQVGTAYAQYNFTEKLRFQPTEKLNIVFANHISRSSDVPRYDRLIQEKNDVSKYGDWYYGPQKWMMNSVDMDWKTGYVFFDQMKLVIARQDFGESRHDRKFGNPIIRERFEKVVAYSANMDFSKAVGNNSIYYGAEAVYNNITSEAESWDSANELSSSTATRYPDGVNSYHAMAAYAGFNFNISSIFFINTGARYNYSALYSTIEDNSFYNFPFTEIDISNSAVTGSVGMVLLPNDKTKLNLNLSSGFRAPNLDDVGKVFDSEPGNVLVPNPSLDPEYAWNADLGISRDFWDAVQIELVGFITLLENAMVRRDYSFNGNDSILYNGEMSNVLAIVNAGDALVYGAHASLQIVPSKSLRFKSNINYTKGEDQDGIPLRHVSPLYGSTHFIYESKKFKADIYANYNGELSYSQLAPSEQNKPYIYACDKNEKPYSPAWFSVNFKTSYQLGTFGIINAGIENILNHRYRPYSSGMVAPGRNFILSLRVVI
jgi:hemoglobin/transferrin/lactoferrin receptor protein